MHCQGITLCWSPFNSISGQEYPSWSTSRAMVYNTARLAKDHGDIRLAQISGTIASDEKHHETAYTKMVEKLWEIDPGGIVLAFADMMRKLQKTIGLKTGMGRFWDWWITLRATMAMIYSSGACHVCWLVGVNHAIYLWSFVWSVKAKSFLGSSPLIKLQEYLKWAAKDQEKEKLLSMRFLNTLADIAS